MRDLFTILDLDQDADDAAIRVAYRRTLADLHPDRLPPTASQQMRDFAQRACAELTGAFAAYAADPVAYRRAARGSGSESDSPPEGEPCAVDLDHVQKIVAAAVETFVPLSRAASASRLVSLIFTALRARDATGRPPPTSIPPTGGIY